MNKIGKLISQTTPSVHLIETIIIALVLFSTSLSQIKINERVEIKPTLKISADVNSNQSRFVCFGEDSQNPLKILGPCKIVATGSLSDKSINSGVIYLISINNGFRDITSRTDSLPFGCETLGVVVGGRI